MVRERKSDALERERKREEEEAEVRRRDRRDQRDEGKIAKKGKKHTGIDTHGERVTEDIVERVSRANVVVVIVAVAANIPGGGRGTGRSCAHDGYAPGTKATFRSPASFYRGHVVHADAAPTMMTEALLLLLLPAAHHPPPLPMHCSPSTRPLAASDRVPTAIPPLRTTL